MSTAQLDSIDELLTGTPYVAYSYAYPHKTAYRPLDGPLDLREAWAPEQKDSLFLYLHVPFCEYRCGFCNLFTLARPDSSLPAQYLAAVRRQAEATRAALAGAKFTRLAIGGGTPTFLSLEELQELFRIIASLGIAPGTIPLSCEASPATLSPDKLAFLRDQGVSRLSLGIQSFDETDARAMGRPQQRGEAEHALNLISELHFPRVNLDLIYGGETQSRASWLATVQRAIDYRPQEIYLYPLYVRPLTGLARLAHEWDDFRLGLYRVGRDLLLASGYEQVSMRMFQLAGAASDAGPIYCCQDDGMIGLGCGARSYTRDLHYSCEYAVGTRAVGGILADFMRREASDFSRIDYGFSLNEDEQRRRLLILSLLQATGLSRAHYRRRFQSDVFTDFPQLPQLIEAGLAEETESLLQLTPSGLERSDAIGPWLYSPAVRQRTGEYAWR